MTHVAARARVPKKAFLVFALVALLMLGIATYAVVSGLVNESKRVTIVQVVDGNTVVIDAHGDERTVQMAGVRSAIRNPDNLRGGPNMCLGERSYVWLRDRLVEGATARVNLITVDEQTYATFRLGGEDVNAAMAEAGMAAPTRVGVAAATRSEIDAGNDAAQRLGRGLYNPSEACTYNSALHEAQFAMQQISDDAEGTVEALDARSEELATAVDAVRLVQQEIAALDPATGQFKDIAWAPARERLQEAADGYAQDGLNRLRALNERRNQLAD
ncbi:MAG: nuclease [Micrococcus sp.]|nr:nuclease [Micrococcus sp.]